VREGRGKASRRLGVRGWMGKRCRSWFAGENYRSWQPCWEEVRVETHHHDWGRKGKVFSFLLIWPAFSFTTPNNIR